MLVEVAILPGATNGTVVQVGTLIQVGYVDCPCGRRQAEDADRLKTRLLANVSHELRAPLNVILGYSQVALAAPNAYGVELPPALRRDLERIYASGDHLRHLINDLLDLSRAEVDALDLLIEPIEAQPFLEDIFRSASSNAEAQPGVEWRLEIAAQLPVVSIDPVRLRQVLDNLLNNARAATCASWASAVRPPPTCPSSAWRSGLRSGRSSG